MKLEGSVALVTGANRGIGLAFVRALRAHGAAKVYAGVREPQGFHEPGAEPLRLDVTEQLQVEAAAAAAGDVTILINNAGIQAGPGLLEGSFDGARREMDVPKVGAWEVAEKTMAALEAGEDEVLVDDVARRAEQLFPARSTGSARRDVRAGM